MQTAMEEMERMEAKGDATPEEIEALAQELSSKMLLTTWKATRWEVINVGSGSGSGGGAGESDYTFPYRLT